MDELCSEYYICVSTEQLCDGVLDCTGGVDELCSEYYICVSTEQLYDEYLTVLEEWMSYVVSIISV